MGNRFRDSRFGQCLTSMMKLALLALVLLLNLAQDLAWERWTKCNDGSVRLLRIERDGKLWAQGTTDGGSPLHLRQACMREAAALQGKQGVSKLPTLVVADLHSPLPARLSFLNGTLVMSEHTAGRVLNVPEPVRSTNSMLRSRHFGEAYRSVAAITPARR